MSKISRILILLAVVVFVLIAVFDQKISVFWESLHFPSLNLSKISKTTGVESPGEKVKIVSEESVVIDVAERVSPSVVSIGIKKTQTINNCDTLDCIFQKPDLQEKTIEQDIGSGFIISEDGLIVTNRHVVDDLQGVYSVVTKDNKSYQVVKIYRDKLNDVAIIKVSAVGLKPVELGDSGKIRVGQLAIAIGTALGEFRHTVTTGVVSGLGRGISAGNPFEGVVEKLDDLIQTSAAINPGNSGGPLLNSAGQVVGINTAVSQEGQNIGFAIPINLVKKVINKFNETGQFTRPFLGVRYEFVDSVSSIRYKIPQGAYVNEVVAGAPAEKAGIQKSDIIIKIDGQILNNSDTLSGEIDKHKVGDKVSIEVWRSNETKTLSVTLEESR